MKSLKFRSMDLTLTLSIETAQSELWAGILLDDSLIHNQLWEDKARNEKPAA